MPTTIWFSAMSYKPQNLSVCWLEKQKEALQRTIANLQDNVRHPWMFRTVLNCFRRLFLWDFCSGKFCVLYNLQFFLLSDRCFKCRQLHKCSECTCSVVLLLSLCFSVKALKTLGNQYCNGLKTSRVQAAVYSILFLECLFICFTMDWLRRFNC